MARFGEWLQNQRRRVYPKSRLGEKLTYIHRQFNGLQTFLHDGRVEIDSTAIENLIRPIALTRKNAIFAGYNEGGRAWGRIASLIATAKINGHLRSDCSRPPCRIDDLLPWNSQPPS